MTGHTTSAPINAKAAQRAIVLEQLWKLVKENRLGTYTGTAALMYVQHFDRYMTDEEKSL